MWHLCIKRRKCLRYARQVYKKTRSCVYLRPVSHFVMDSIFFYYKRAGETRECFILAINHFKIEILVYMWLYLYHSHTQISFFVHVWLVHRHRQTSVTHCLHKKTQKATMFLVLFLLLI